MTFIHDWFSYNIPVWKKILKKYKGKENLHFLEIGCFEGRATKWLLENILTHKTSKITVIDTFEGSMENNLKGFEIDQLLRRFKENLSPYIRSNKKLNKVIIQKGLSHLILRKLIPIETYDFIYVDGSHISKDVLEDALLSWRLLRKNGIMIFDDYDWHMYDDPLLCPNIAIDVFLKIFESQYKLIHQEHQVIVQKKGDNIIRKKMPSNNSNYSYDYSLLKEQLLNLETKNNLLELSLKKIESDLQLIQSSKTYKLWQLFCKNRKRLLGK